VGRTIDRTISGKTGTTDANRAAWFVGFTPSLAGAAFYVDPDAPNTSSVPNSRVPIEVFKKAMVGSLPYTPDIKFVPPTRARAYGNDSSANSFDNSTSYGNGRSGSTTRRHRNQGSASLPSPAPSPRPTKPKPKPIPKPPASPPPGAIPGTPHATAVRFTR
jgi:membrane peptidoglycan carboxypeptidase